MNSLGILVSFLACTWLSWYMTGHYVTFALEHRLVDIPNERSSHTRITPRGGGIIFVILVLGTIILLGMLRDLPISLPLRIVAALLAGAGVALIGYLDDWHGVSIKMRLFVQLSVTSLTLLLICGNPFHTFTYPTILIAAGSMFAVFLYTWLINLVNFMDGIDGLAASGAICVSGICCLLIVIRHGSDELSFLFGILACATLGFLIWNWPGAHVFMGDAGSYFLGFALGALMLLGMVRHELGTWVIPILFGAYIIDASATVINRMRRRETWYKPHRLHGFQHAADAFGHRNVTLAVIAITLIWLVPLAVSADLHPHYGLAFLVVAWLPLIVLSYLFHSGEVLAPHAIPRWRTVLLIVNCNPKSIYLRLALRIRRLAPFKVSLARVLLITASSVASMYVAFAIQSGIGVRILQPRLLVLFGIFCMVQLGAFLAFGVHRCHWHLISIQDFPNTAGISLIATLAGVIVFMALTPKELSSLPASFFIVQTVCLTSIIVLIRMIAACLSRHPSTAERKHAVRRVIIYGADDAGLDILWNLRRLGQNYRIIGYVDPRDFMKGVSIAGCKVLGVDADIQRIANLYNIDDVLVSSAAARSATGGRFLRRCTDAAVDVRIIPSIEHELQLGMVASPVRARIFS